MSRLSKGGLIDRNRQLSFTFDGKRLFGFEGDTLASALVANDVRIIGRSFKYHRPRGILTAGNEEPNALVTLRKGARAEPNTRATTVSLFDGLEATSQNCWPSPSFDMMSINQLFAPIFVAGFYYKTFMWPAKAWEKLYEPLIRRAAGLGKLSSLPDPDTYDREHGFCDLLVIGAGPAGLAAALTAGRSGLRVIVVNDDPLVGGRLLSEQLTIDGMMGCEWARMVAAELATLANVQVLKRTTVFGVYDGREYGAIERVSDHLPQPNAGQPRQRLWKIVAKRAIIAAGAIESPIVFGGNDRPGVMMSSAVSTFINRFAASPGRRALIFTTSDSGWETACSLRRGGIDVAAVVDTRVHDAALASQAELADVPKFFEAVVTDVQGRTVRSADVRTSRGKTYRIDCDFVGVSGGWNPAIGLASHLGSRPVWSERIQSFVIDKAPPGLVPAGAAAGHFALGDVLASGVAVATEAIEAVGARAVAPPRFEVTEDRARVSALWHVPARRTKAFVDFQHDVTDADIDLAVREGFVSIEHLKRYTTLGMATDQGKSSQLNGHALLAAATGQSIAEVGTILSRPPYLPVAIGALAGHHREADYRPVRKTISHEWAVEQNATFVDVGQWKRAQWFARPGELDWRETVDREVNAVRSGVGVVDVSTLGKIDVHGPDAGILLDRLYINTFSTLAIGKARYGVMLREDGIVLDDGTSTRFDEDRFFVTTTTVNAAKVMQHIDYARQVLWPDLDVQATSVTEQWATYAVAGPLSRVLLQEVFSDFDLSNCAFPYMAAAETTWRGGPARIIRVSFSGELAFEVSVPARDGRALLQALFESGCAMNVTAYGTEALGVMRIEKGHPAGGELNGMTTARDLGMARMMSTKKAFIGQMLARRAALVDPHRPAFVGVRPLVPTEIIRGGAHLLSPGAEAIAANDEGYITSAAWSPTVGSYIALALVRRGPERYGERIVIHDPVRGRDVEAQIVDPVFVDPQGVRVRA